MPGLRYTGGSRYALRDGPTWESGDVHDVDGATADRLADLDKFERVESDGESSDGEMDTDGGSDEQDEPVSVGSQIENGVCPWCDDYEGENVGMHASRAHPDSWEEYNA